MRLSTAAPPSPTVEVEAVPMGGAFAAAPATDASTVLARTDATPAWWQDMRSVLHDPILSRVTRLSVADPSVMPLTVARDVGADEPEVDEAATRRIVPLLASPLADRFSTWLKHVTLIATLGRSYWLHLMADDVAPLPWPDAGAWVVVSPLNRSAGGGGDRVACVLDGGHRVEVAASRLIMCQRSGRVLSGEPYSELRTLVDQAQLSDRCNTALWARVDTSAQGTKVLAIKGGEYVPRQSTGGTSGPQAKTIVQRVMATLAKRLQSIVTLRKDAAARAPIVVSGGSYEGDPLGIADMTVNVDGGLAAVGRWSDERIAIGAGVPTAQLTGESPKYSNMFADRLQFARSESGVLAREVAAAAMPVLAKITEGTPDEGTIWWLDPAPLIEEAQQDAAASRGTMAAALDVPRETSRVNALVERAERDLFDGAEQLVLGAEDDTQRYARRMASDAVAALVALRSELGAPLDPTEVGALVDGAERAALDALQRSRDELGGEALAAAIGLPTFVRRIVAAVKRTVFGEPETPAADPDAPPPILDTVGISPYVRSEFGDALQRWVYGLPSSREHPYPPHMANDGLLGRGVGDFPGEEPDGSPAIPGGHAGCQCYLVLAEPTP